MPAITVPEHESRPARLMIRYKIIRNRPDPAGYARWEVSTRRFFILQIELGEVFAGSREEAMQKARLQFPDEKKLYVEPADSEDDWHRLL